MATTTVIAATTAAISTKAPRYHATHAGEVTFSATGLGVGETITPFIGGGATWTQVRDSDGVAVTISDTKPQLTLPAGGCLYAFDKTSSSGAVSLEANPNYL